MPWPPRHEVPVAERLAKAGLALPGSPGFSGTPLGDANAASMALANRVAGGAWTNPTPQAEQAMAEQGLGATAAFSPGRPLNPYYGISGTPRRFDFQTGYNITTRPRAEAGLVSFDTLRQIIDGYDIAQIAIKHRIDDLRSLGYKVVAKDARGGDVDDQIAAAEKFLERPDGEHDLHEWLWLYLSDVLKYDAGTLWRERSRKGDLIGLHVLDGTDIMPLLDYYGAKPEAPAPAFTQFMNGVPWEWFTTDDLIYRPFRPRTNSVYGLPPMEWLLLNANTDIRFQWHFLQYFTEGSVPSGFMEAPPDMSNAAQLEEWQSAWDAFLEGDQSQKQKIRWVPNGAKYTAAKDQAFSDAFSLFLMRKTAAAYSVNANALGFTENSNRSTGEVQEDIEERIGARPLAIHVDSIINRVLWDDLGLTGIRFTLDVGQQKEDQLTEAQAMQIYIQNGVVSPDWVAETILGIPQDKANPTPRYIFSTRAGAIPLKSLVEIAGDIDPETAAPINVEQIDPEGFAAPNGIIPQPDDLRTKTAPTQPVPPQLQPFQGQQPPVADASTDEKPATGAGDAQPVTKEGATAGIGAGSGIVGYDLQHGDDDDELDDDELEKALAAWKRHALTRIRKGKPVRRFAGLPEDITTTVWKHLSHATSRDDVLTAFAKAGGAEPRPAHPKAVADRIQIEDAVVAYYQPALLTALQALVPGLQSILTTVLDEHPGVVRKSVQPIEPSSSIGPEEAALLTEAVNAFRQRADGHLDTSALLDVMRAIYADTYLAATHLAAGQAGGSVVASFADLSTSVDWAAWTPGWAEAAERVASVGLQQLLAEADVTVRGIASTALDRLSNVLADGLANGLPARAIGAGMGDILDDPARGDLIALTESARAMTASTLETYTANGIQQWQWIDSAGACPTCVALAAGGPYSGNDQSPPAHPRCRCTTSPVINIPEAPSA